MKKFFLRPIPAVLIAVAAMFLSCEKNDDSISNSNLQENKEVHSLKLDVKGIGLVDFEFWDDGGPIHGVDYGRRKPPRNCMFPITIFAENVRTIEDVFAEIENGSPEDIIDAFETNEAVLKRYLGSDIVDNVIDGEFDVRHRGENIQEMRYMLFSETTDYQLIIAAPMFEER